MGEGFVSDLIINAAVLLALSVIYEIGHILPRTLTKYRTGINGLLIGVAVVAVMSVPFRMIDDPGIVFDTRSILLFSAGITFGPLPAIIGAAIAAIYRISDGGTGVYTGLAVIITSTAMGILSRKWMMKSQRTWRWLKCYLVSLANHLIMIACFLLIPMPRALQVIREIAAPVLIIYPIVTVVLCVILLHQIERNEALLRLAAEDGYYKNLFDDNNAVMLLTEIPEGKIVDANTAACRFYGWSHDEMIRMNVNQINTLPDAEIKKKFGPAYEQKKYPVQFKHRLADGHIRDVELYSGDIKINGKNLLYSIIHDVSDRVAADRRLQISEYQNRTLVENAPDGIFLVQENRFVYLNPAMLRMYGAESESQLIGTDVGDRFHPDYREIILNKIKTARGTGQSMLPDDEVHCRLDGQPFYVNASAVPFSIDGKPGALIFVRDISRQKQMEEERAAIEAKLQQQQKLEAIGTLAGGVAHEINNPITGIMNYAQLILDSAETGTATAEFAGEIIHESERVSEIVKNLLQFSRQEKKSHSYASLYDIVSQTVSLINTIVRKDQINLLIKLDDDLPAIRWRSQQIQQVLMNLLTNARDTLNEKYPDYAQEKRIVVSCHAFTQENRRWIRLTVEDNGSGIPADVADKVFNPFFSTKPKEKGTGLGLAISFGIIQDHHGSLNFETAVGEYTRFHLDLPVDNGWGDLPEEVS